MLMLLALAIIMAEDMGPVLACVPSSGVPLLLCFTFGAKLKQLLKQPLSKESRRGFKSHDDQAAAAWTPQE